MRSYVLCLAAIVAAGCIPTRDNEHDPSNRPTVAMEITVAGRTSALGGRNEAWRLDATGSRAKHGSLSLEWAISSDGPNLASEVSEWTVVGSETIVVSTAGNLLHDRLVAISDFAGYDEPGTGLARRASFPALDAPPLFEPTEFRKSLSGDAFYRHYFVAVEGGESPVIRLDSTGQEVSRFNGPREVVSVCR